jgi:acetyl-CoA acyltransferase
MLDSHDVVIVHALRTPVGKYGGILRHARPDDLSGLILSSLVQRSGIDAGCVDDVIWGCSNQAGEDNRNIARMALLLAGFPHSVPGVTVNRLCGSSLEAVVQAVRAIRCGDAEIIVAGGVECMSRAPFALAKQLPGHFGNAIAYDTALGWRFPNPRMSALFPLESMGETAENIAQSYHIGRDEQDHFALQSHRKAVRAQDSGVFLGEIVPVEGPNSSNEAVLITQDEGPRRDTSIEKLASLKPVFREGGTVTAGNSSGLNDGAAGLLLMSASRAHAEGITPLARFKSAGVAGVDPRFMGLGPIPATRTAFRKAGMEIGSIDVIELNEAFAAQAIAVIRELRLPEDRTNPNGGAIALGHPLGCSGARILTTLIHEMIRRNAGIGLATMCIGVGQGMSIIVERAG